MKKPLNNLHYITKNIVFYYIVVVFLFSDHFIGMWNLRVIRKMHKGLNKT